MDKKVVMFGAVVGMTVGSFVPMLWGDNNLLGGVSLLFTLIGGFIGIWIGVKLKNRYL